MTLPVAICLPTSLEIKTTILYLKLYSTPGFWFCSCLLSPNSWWVLHLDLIKGKVKMGRGVTFEELYSAIIYEEKLYE